MVKWDDSEPFPPAKQIKPVKPNSQQTALEIDALQESKARTPHEELAPVPPSLPTPSEPEARESEPGLAEPPAEGGQDWLAAWDPEKENPPTDASRTLYAIIKGETSRDGKKIMAFLREHYNTPAALVRLREYDLKMAKWASRRSRPRKE